MRFHLFRSRAFWFGVPGLVFLLWWWADSMKWSSAVGYTTLGGILTEPGLVQITLTSPKEKKYLTPSFRSRRNKIENPPKRWFPKHYGKFISGAPGEERYIVLPFWKLIALYSTLWTGLVLWHRSRHHRMIAAPPPSDCGDDSPLSSSR